MQDRIYIENAVKSYYSSLESREMGQKFVLLDEVDSTSAYIRRIETDGECRGTVCAALRQTEGRGRLGRSWLSEGEGLYLSAAAFAKSADLARLPLAAACAVSEAFRKLGIAGAGIKWPNDIILSGKKVCGILCQAWGERAAIGIGVNISQSRAAFEQAQLPNAASLAMLGFETDMWTLAAVIVTELERYCDMINAGEFAPLLELYRESCISLGREVVASGASGEIRGTASDIAPDGSLVIETDGGRVSVSSGEVKLRTVKGYI